VYEYWTLCQSGRTERGPRKRVVGTFGKFSEEDLLAGWEDIEALLDGRRPTPRQKGLFDNESSSGQPQPQWEMTDVGNIGVERVREFGSVYLAPALW
jgi:hypothetical protein